MEDVPLESMHEESMFGQERNYAEISSAEAAREDLDYAKEEGFMLEGADQISCAAQPEFALLTEDEEGIMLAVSKTTKEDLTKEGKDCNNMELKEDEEFLVPLKKDGDTLLPVKEDEENLLTVKEDGENVLQVEGDKETIMPEERYKAVPVEEIQEAHLSKGKSELCPMREGNENLLSVDEDTEIPFSGERVKPTMPVEEEDDILLPKVVDNAPKAQDNNCSSTHRDEKEEQRQPAEPVAVSNISSSFPESPLEWDSDGAEGWEPEEAEEVIGNQGWAL